MKTLGEGNTPLVESSSNQDLYYKNEGINPTGSFKDRGTALTVEKALEQDVENLHICSSGNAALSLAVYCQKAGIDCICHIPQKTSEGKKQLMKAFGADLKEYDAIYEKIFHHLQDAELEGWNVTPGAADISMQAYEEIASEIIKDGIEPDQVIVPCGNGTNLAGIWQGFKSHGLEPEMIGVQIEGSSPIKKALEEEIKHGVVEDPGESMAEGIIASESFNCAEAVKAIKESSGCLETVEECEIEKGMNDLMKEGVVCEPTSAIVKPVSEKYSGTTVAVITGSGLKNHDKIKKISGSQQKGNSAFNSWSEY